MSKIFAFRYPQNLILKQEKTKNVAFPIFIIFYWTETDSKQRYQATTEIDEFTHPLSLRDFSVSC